MAKVLLFGANGQVGGELVRTLQPLGDLIVAPRELYDLLRPESLEAVVKSERPDLVVNAAADTVVDRKNFFEDGLIANRQAPGRLAQACESLGARLIHYSTDYVFDGEKRTPYTETDPTNPVNAYGNAKLGGERRVLEAGPRHLVLRLSWVYSTRGRNFALTMLRLAREGKPIRVVDDQWGAPTYARAIAEGTAVVAENLLREPSAEGGLYHLSCAGETTWRRFAQTLLMAALGADAPNVEPISTDAYPSSVRRPAYSVLSNEKIRGRFGVTMPSWEAGVARWAADLAAAQP